MSPLALSLRFLQAQPDARLVELARQGHDPAFEALVRRYRAELLSYCRRLQPRSGNAEDALQQTLLQAWRALNDGLEVRDVRPWLYRIAHNVSLNSLRVTVATAHEVVDAPATVDFDQLVEQRSQARAAFAGMASLPPLQRQVFVSTTLDGASHEEVATALGLSGGAVRGLVYRARAIVRAAAAAITPSPVLSWAMRRAENGSGGSLGLAEAIAGGGGAGVAAAVAKGGAVLTLAVAGAGGVVLSQPAEQHGRAGRQIERPASERRTPPGSFARTAGLTAQPAHAATGEQSRDRIRQLGADQPSAGKRDGGRSNGHQQGSGELRTGGHDRASRGGSDGGSSGGSGSGSSGGSDRGSSGGSGSGSSGSSGSGSSGSSGGGGSDGTSMLTTSGSDGGTGGGGPGPSSAGPLTVTASTSDGGSGPDGGTSGGSGGGSSSGLDGGTSGSSDGATVGSSGSSGTSSTDGVSSSVLSK
jgi:RNA polymerase sigma factor (sigma-70 family)